MMSNNNNGQENRNNGNNSPPLPKRRKTDDIAETELEEDQDQQVPVTPELLQSYFAAMANAKKPNDFLLPY